MEGRNRKRETRRKSRREAGREEEKMNGKEDGRRRQGECGCSRSATHSASHVTPSPAHEVVP